MKKSFGLGLLVVFMLSLPSMAEAAAIEPTPTPVKVVVTNTLPPPKHFPTPTPRPRVVEIAEVEADEASGPNAIVNTAPPIVVGSAARTTSANSSSGRTLAFTQIKSKIAEAKRQMQSRPMPTALTDTALSTNWVRIAFHDWETNQIDYIVLSKTAFLSTKELKQTVSTNGKTINIATIRGNGVNTPVVLTDTKGQNHLPLMVQYPVERGGRYLETAYYMSTHPGLVNGDVVAAGQFYIHNVLELARDRLKKRGISIAPKTVDVAEKLALLEHVDHQRFRTEIHRNIYDDVFTLYALNEGQTYRYSVSSAGAGGMVQMIPSTYRMVRNKYPQVNLMPDFVEGMRNHVNAAQAMLLYMQWTWSDLMSSPTVFGALQSGIATQEELMAAGYNSNPARLAGYISRGGENWTALIPRETKVYLQILDSIEKYVKYTPRTR